MQQAAEPEFGNESMFSFPKILLKIPSSNVFMDELHLSVQQTLFSHFSSCLI